MSLRERGLLVWDLAMLALASANLALIIAVWIDDIGLIHRLIAAAWPIGQAAFQSSVVAQFDAINLGFVAVFIVDVLAGWLVAIQQKTHVRWFFYPFVHWYDVLGCIPVAGFRFLRVLRVFSALARLHRLGVIDVRSWALFQSAMVYYDIVAEEISDRVVIKIISGAQGELQSGGNRMVSRAINEVFEPRRELLVERAASQLEQVINESYQTYRSDLQRYVADVVHRGVACNAAVKNLEQLPLLGRTLNHALDDAIVDTVNSVLDEAVESCTRAEFKRIMKPLIDQIVERLILEEAGEPSELEQALIETLELVKDQVAIKQWRSYFETGQTPQSYAAEAHSITTADR